MEGRTERAERDLRDTPPMRAAVLWAFDDLRVEELELDPPRPGEVTLRMAASGVCRSDHHAVRGVHPHAMPIVLGHEGSAVVEAVEPMGRETLYLLDTPLGALRALEAGAQRSFGPGDRTQVGFAPRDTLLFDVASERRLPARVSLVA